ncbi:putative dynein light chain [Besnoitia besnoiti]|uniref:Dynein axonemal light chain 1 n=1 Tax=Besnoitia besnoiti TaxID=94643 RepID=A0A2A9MFR3_BESBE|nr:putative dynein light chain [Besnoitia besnoiti]PFH34826.1 putative dynein light chain [Besnoitia besnoiti]
MKSSGGTTCAKAIQLFEEKTGQTASDAEEVKLICMLPPIEKMDNSLNTLTTCRHLSLSTNSIEKMINLPNLSIPLCGRSSVPCSENLQILSLARNQIKRISGLEEVGQTLRELWLSYNQIERLDGLQPCVKLEVLYMSNNKVKGWEEVEKLAALPTIVNVLFKGNPFYDTVVTEDMREKALTLP